MNGTEYQASVTVGLFADVLGVLAAHGIRWADDDPRRRADALIALCQLADAVALATEPNPSL